MQPSLSNQLCELTLGAFVVLVAATAMAWQQTPAPAPNIPRAQSAYQDIEGLCESGVYRCNVLADGSINVEGGRS